MRIAPSEPERYVAGFADKDGEPWGASVPLEPDDVEAAVLQNLSMTISMNVDGALLIEVEGRGDAANAAPAASGGRSQFPVDEIVRQTLDPDLLPLDDDVRGDLLTLRKRLANALDIVDEALRNGD